MMYSQDYIQALNQKYFPLSPIDRLKLVFEEFDKEDILFTSSFGTTSGILLGMVSKVAPNHPLHFIDTTFCFRKTMKYKETLTKLFNLNVIDVVPNIEENLQSREQHLWKENPNLCCFYNKIKPFEEVKKRHKIWISGLLMNQTPFRQNLNIFEVRGEMIKMHPNIDSSPEFFDQFLKENHIPPHPMIADGYQSVGCTHCTISGDGRDGRWAGNQKVECGLHL